MTQTLKEYCQNCKKSLVLCAALTLICVVIFYATFPLYCKITLNSSVLLFVFLNIIALLPLTLFAINLLFVRAKWLNITSLALAIAAIVEHVLYLAYALSKLYYLIVVAGPYILIAAQAATLLLAIFLPRLKHKKAFRAILICGLSAAFVFTTFFVVFDLRPLYLNTDAVVFAVDDEYQIAFGASANCVGYVQVGDKTFYDSYSGANRVSTVHKVCVPRDLLEREKNYKIGCKQVVRAQAYLPIGGATIQKEYTFRPVDLDDGLQIFNFSDNHLLQSGVVKASSYWSDKLDLVIANGDLTNDVTDEYQITLMYRTLAKISGGGGSLAPYNNFTRKS